MSIIIIAVLSIIFLILWACLDIVPQAEARVIERLGVFHAVWNSGVHVKIPILDKAVVPHIDMREQMLELPKIGSHRDENKVTTNGVVDDMSMNSYYSKKNNSYGSISIGADFAAGGSIDANGSASAEGIAKGSGNASAAAAAGTQVEFGTGIGGYYTKTYKNSTRRFQKGSRVYEGETSYSNYRDVITKDNVPMVVDAVLFYQVTDPKQYAYGMKQPLFALQKLAVTNLRNIIGTLELDETLCSRDLINSKLRAALDEATDSWGLKITRVEIESIVPPPQIQAAMEMQATAERVKRATILDAEGRKQATILEAEAEKQKLILEAEGILREKELEALANKALNENAPIDSVIRLKAIQAMEVIAQGESNKIIIPTDMAGLVGLANGLTEGVTPHTAPVVK